MKRAVKITAILMLLALAGCGKFGPLEPRAGASSAPLAYGQDKPAETDAFTTAPVQARPGRSDELLRRSERRSEDPFDLPPSNDNARFEKPENKAPVPVIAPEPKSR